MPKTLRLERNYPYRPEDVWVALTDPRAIAEWLMPNDFKPVVGHKFRLQVDPMPGCGGLNECEVIECEPPRRLAYTWVVVPRDPSKPKPPAMTIRWMLHPEQNRTRLVFEQTGLEVLTWWERFSMRFGWGTMVKRWLPKVASRVKGGTFTPGAIPLNKRCYKTKTLSSDLTW